MGVRMRFSLELHDEDGDGMTLAIRDDALTEPGREFELRATTSPGYVGLDELATFATLLDEFIARARVELEAGAGDG